MIVIKAPMMPWCSSCVILVIAMHDQVKKWTGLYGANLQKYLKRRDEANLSEAYELGRKAITRGLGILDMVRIHQAALMEVLESDSGSSFSVLDGAASFFMEAVSPFEATQRGFREANLELKSLNAVLAERNAKLG